METKKFTQTGTFSIAVMVPIFIFSIIMIFISGLTDLSMGGLFVFLALTFLICLLIFYKITIIVDDDSVEFRLGTGIVRKKYPLESIEECIPVKNSPLTGIGIRMLKNGWLYNVSGTRAVELRFKNRKSVVRIGTDQPENVAAAVNSRLNKSFRTDVLLKESNTGWYLAMAIIFLLLFLPAILIITGSKQTGITTSESGLKIEGIYGLTIRYEDVLKIDTLKALPSIRMRTNGFASGSILKGNFQLSDHSKVKLFVNKKKPPFIVVKTTDNVVYFNRDNPAETTSMFMRIKDHTSR